MNDATKKRLLDALLACRAIGRSTSGRDFAAYERNDLIRDAVERRLGIVGEALGIAARGDASHRDRLPTLRQTVGLRNRAIRGYDSVDDEIVRDVVRHKLPALEAGIVALLGEDDDAR